MKLRGNHICQKISYGLELVINLSWIRRGWEIETKKTLEPCLNWWKLVFLSNPCPQEVFLDKMVTQHVKGLCLPLSIRQRLQWVGTCQATWDFTCSCTSDVEAAAAKNDGNWALCLRVLLTASQAWLKWGISLVSGMTKKGRWHI